MSKTTKPTTDSQEPAADDPNAAAAAEGDGVTEDAGQDAGADPAARIEELEREVAGLSDRLLRAAAETENVRKRAQKEREDAGKYATSRFAEDMLAVVDNLARALDAVTGEARRDEAGKGLIEGVELTLKDLTGVLQRHGIVAVEAAGARFDPNFHQAMFEIETPDAEPGTVMQVLRIGYTIHGRLLRPAMVGIAKAPGDPAPDA